MPQTHVHPAREPHGESILTDMGECGHNEEYLHTRYIDKALEEAEQQAKDPTVRSLSHAEVSAKLRNKWKHLPEDV